MTKLYGGKKKKKKETITLKEARSESKSQGAANTKILQDKSKRKQPVGTNISRIGDKIPLLGGVVRGSKKLAVGAIEAGSKAVQALGGKGFSEERISATKEYFGIDPSKRLIQDPDVQQFIATGVLAGVGGVIAKTGIVGKVAPNMAKFLGAGKAASGKAVITRTAFQKGAYGKTVELTTQRAFGVSAKTATGLAKQLAAMDKVTIMSVVKRGAGFALRHKAGVAAVTGTQTLFTWYAADNILQSAAIFSRDTAENVRFGNISVGDAKEGLDDSQIAVNTARRFIKVSVAINPLLWPFGKLLLTGAEGTQRQIDFQKTLIGIE